MHIFDESPWIFNTRDMDASEHFVIITGPLGGEQKRFTKMLCDDFNHYRKIVLFKTKPKSDKETAGVDGYFIDKQRFGEMVGDSKFLFYRSLPDGNFEGFSHWHAGENNEWGRPLLHTCDYDEALNFKTMLGEKCCIVYLNNQSNIEISLEQNPEITYIVNATDTPNSVLENLKYVIKKYF